MSNNKQIPTAKEFLNRDESGVFNEIDITQAMIEFAKLHVEAALKAALENSLSDITTYANMKEAILESYPLNNIK